MVKNLLQCRRLGFNPWIEGNGNGNGNLLQYSCLEDSMDRGSRNAVDYAGDRWNIALTTILALCKMRKRICCVTQILSPSLK